MKFLTTILIFALCFFTNAQEINLNGTPYKVKGKAILQDGVDVTATLSAEQQTAVFEALSKEQALEKERKAAEKALKKAENEQKRAEKKQKKAEKELKAKEKAKSNYDKVTSKYNKAVEKHEKLKNKGKLSPVDEAKSLKNVQKLKEAIEKAKKKL